MTTGDWRHQPTMVARYHFPDTDYPGGRWHYCWWDYPTSFVGGSAPDREKWFTEIGGVLAAILADTARTLTTGQVEEHGSES